MFAMDAAWEVTSNHVEMADPSLYVRGGLEK